MLIEVLPAELPETRTCDNVGVPAFVLLITLLHVADIVVGPVVVCDRVVVVNDVVVPVPE
jgi:hypothetical protein